MKEFDIITTATLRPEILKRTFDSFIDNLFGSWIEYANLIINVDMVGSEDPEGAREETTRYLAGLPFKDLTIQFQDKPHFGKAFAWCLSRINNHLVFNLEDDWELTKKLNFYEMVDLMDQDNRLKHLRLSAFHAEGTQPLKVWNKFIKWNGSYYEIPRSLNGTIGWAGHPSLNKAGFLLSFRSILDPRRNPEKQIKGGYQQLTQNRFGVFHPQGSPAAILDLGRKWMVDNKYRKHGNKAHFTKWDKED